MPTIKGQHQKYTAAKTGAFELTVFKLINSKKYFARAYASNSHGTSYSNQVEFVIPDPTLVFLGKAFKYYGKLDAKFEQCKDDDILRFEDSGVLKVDGNLVKCDLNDPQVISANWSLVEGGGMLKMDWLGEDHVFFYRFTQGGDLYLTLDEWHNGYYSGYQFYFQLK